MSYFNTCRESLYLLVVFGLFKPFALDLVQLRVVVEDGSWKHEHDGRSEVFALQIQVIHRWLFQMLIVCFYLYSYNYEVDSYYVVDGEVFSSYQVFFNQGERVSIKIDSWLD